MRHQNWFGKLYAEKLTDIFLYSSARDPLLNMNRDANHYELFVVYTNFHCFFVTTSGEVETTNSKKAHAVFGRGRVFVSNAAVFSPGLFSVGAPDAHIFNPDAGILTPTLVFQPRRSYF